MSELLFEAYGVPAASYAIDAALSFYYNMGEWRDGIIIDSGHNTTHVLPLLNGTPCTSNCSRITLGG